MAIRVRKDGTMWCAALTDPMPGDTYIDDALHYEMSVIHGVIVAYPMPRHIEEPQWFWSVTAPVDASFINVGSQHEKRKTIKNRAD